MKKLILLTGILMSTICVQTHAQHIQFEELTTAIEGVGTGALAFADIDEDGDEDLMLVGDGNLGKTAKLYTNEGDGNFLENRDISFEGVSFASVAFADIDGDNDQDLLYTGWGSFTTIAKLYRNDGEGNFTQEIFSPIEGVMAGSIAFTDIDGDFDLDLFVTGTSFSTSPSDIISRLYINDGLGNFSESPGAFLQAVNFSSIAFFDMDNDNDQDVIVTGNSTNSSSIGKGAWLFENDGEGNFTHVPETNFPNVEKGSVAVADIDMDGDQDLMITGISRSEFTEIYNSKLYRNDGHGHFTEVSESSFPAIGHGDIAFADIDGDMDQDLVICGLLEPNTTNTIAALYLNDGQGNFSLVENMPFQGTWSSAIAFSDINGDAYLDLLITGLSPLGGHAQLYQNKTAVNVGLSSAIEQKVDLSQNFPNPCIRSTTIRYQLERRSDLKFALYDLNGCIVKQLKLGIKGSGQHTLKFDVQDLVPGVYIYRIQGEGFLRQKKMIVLN